MCTFQILNFKQVLSFFFFHFAHFAQQRELAELSAKKKSEFQIFAEREREQDKNERNVKTREAVKREKQKNERENFTWRIFDVFFRLFSVRVPCRCGLNFLFFNFIDLI